MSLLLLICFKPFTHLDVYDNIASIQEHLEAFQASMLLLRASNAIMCRAFLITLEKASLHWFNMFLNNFISGLT